MSDSRRVGPAKGLDLIVGGEPRVELMPPVVAQRQREAAVRRLMVVVLVATILAVTGGFVVALLQNVTAQVALATAHARTEELLAEEQTYAEGAVVSGLLTKVQGARTLVSADEVLWARVYADIRASLPADVLLEELTLKSDVPWLDPAVPEGPLQATGVARVRVVLITPTFPDTAAVLRALEKSNGFAYDATFESITGFGPYLSTVTYSLGIDALGNRFPAGQEVASDVSDAPGTPTPSPTPSPTPTATTEGEG